jgi:3D (Asp-Asp-Asp) domain-containing protein
MTRQTFDKILGTALAVLVICAVSFGIAFLAACALHSEPLPTAVEYLDPEMYAAMYGDADEPTYAPTATPTTTPSPISTPTPEPTPVITPEPRELTLLGEYQIYGYNIWDAAQCGKAVANGITASGLMATVGRTVAMSSDIPFGTIIIIDGLGEFVVEDRGVGRGVVDVAFDNDADCYAVTSRRLVWIVEGKNGEI